MIASFAASLPVWARFDPLPVLLTDPEREDKELAAREEYEKMSASEKKSADHGMSASEKKRADHGMSASAKKVPAYGMTASTKDGS